LFERPIQARVTGGFLSVGSTEQLAKIVALAASILGVAATFIGLLRGKHEAATGAAADAE
jgi:hypothetical protein